jgi:peptide deformylase
MILNLIDNKNPILHEATTEFDFSNPPVDPIQLSVDLCDTLISHSALGLAANQVGLTYSVFAIKTEPMIVCFNPKIVDSSEEQVYLNEGCLSYENLGIKIKRPGSIRVRYTEPNGETVTKKFTGMTARVFQHEFDHLQGINFKQRANKIHLEKAIKVARKLNKKCDYKNLSHRSRR